MMLTDLRSIAGAFIPPTYTAFTIPKKASVGTTYKQYNTNILSE